MARPKHPNQRFKTTMVAERAAWNAVVHRPPGTQQHDPQLWNVWLAAADAAVEPRGEGETAPLEAERPG